MVNKYKYNGEIEVVVPDLAGTVKPGDIFETKSSLNHPDFELLEASYDVAEESTPEESVTATESSTDTLDAPVEGVTEGE